MAAEFSTDHLLCIADFLDNKDLSSLCRCCKWFNDLIQPRIFHRIALGNPEDEDSPKKWTSFEAFRQVLERSPHLAYYPREVKIRLGGFNTDDLTFVLAELTGKNVSSVKLTAGGWVDASVKQAAEAFLRDTILPLNLKISGLQSISASCLRSTRNLILFNCAVHSTGLPDDWNIKTLSTSGSLSIGTSFFLNTHPCLTHLMLSWEAPSGEPEEWYADLGAGLASMPKLVLLTVQYSGGCTQDGYIEAYASRMQNAMGNRPDRVSLDWRFLHPMESHPVRVIRSLRGLSGWRTISFQVRGLSHEVGEETIRVATDTFLYHSDNYHVRIDEIRGWSWSKLSTWVMNGSSLDTVKRHVHEDAYSHLPWADGERWESERQGWETRTIYI